MHREQLKLREPRHAAFIETKGGLVERYAGDARPPFLLPIGQTFDDSTALTRVCVHLPTVRRRSGTATVAILSERS